MAVGSQAIRDHGAVILHFVKQHGARRFDGNRQRSSRQWLSATNAHLRRGALRAEAGCALHTLDMPWATLQT
jgi:hypothetical protein